MAEQDETTPQPPNDLARSEYKEVLRFLREEADANRKAQREDSDANRKLLVDTFKYASIVLTPLIILAAFLGYRDWSTTKQAIISEAQNEAHAEIAKNNRKIDETLQAQFRTETIEGMIKQAAQSAAEREARPLIEAGVRSEIKGAVAQQSALIQGIAVKAVDSKVKEVVDRDAAEAEKLLGDLHVQDLMARINVDDAAAYDELVKARDSAAPDQRVLIDTIVDGKNVQMETRSRREGTWLNCMDASPYHLSLNSKRSSDRVGAIRDCSAAIDAESQYVAFAESSTSPFRVEEREVPIYARLATSDASLLVRAEATETINRLFAKSDELPAGGFKLLDARGLAKWWQLHQDSYRTALLLSRLSVPGNFDSAALYEEMSGALAESVTASEKEMLAEKLHMMRTRASAHRDVPPGVVNAGCGEIELRSLRRLQYWTEQHSTEPSDEYGTAEIEFLRKCPIIQREILPLCRIVSESALLSRRYAAAGLINVWTSSNIDAFDPESIRTWLSKNEGKYKDAVDPTLKPQQH